MAPEPSMMVNFFKDELINEILNNQLDISDKYV